MSFPSRIQLFLGLRYWTWAIPGLIRALRMYFHPLAFGISPKGEHILMNIIDGNGHHRPHLALTEAQIMHHQSTSTFPSVVLDYAGWWSGSSLFLPEHQHMEHLLFFQRLAEFLLWSWVRIIIKVSGPSITLNIPKFKYQHFWDVEQSDYREWSSFSIVNHSKKVEIMAQEMTTNWHSTFW